MAKKPRIVRLLKRPAAFLDSCWTFTEIPIVKLGEVGRWAMVRHAEHPSAAPFVISLKDWEKMERRND